MKIIFSYRRSRFCETSKCRSRKILCAGGLLKRRMALESSGSVKRHHGHALLQTIISVSLNSPRDSLKVCIRKVHGCCWWIRDRRWLLFIRHVALIVSSIAGRPKREHPACAVFFPVPPAPKNLSCSSMFLTTPMHDFCYCPPSHIQKHC